MARTWTPEARQAQAEAIRRWQPWNNSTGPKTAQGKENCRLNALKHGTYDARSLHRREMSALLRRQRAFLKAVRFILRHARNLAKKCEIRDRTIIQQPLIAEGNAINKAFDLWFAHADQLRGMPAYAQSDQREQRAA